MPGSTPTGPMAAVHRFSEGFNNDDIAYVVVPVSARWLEGGVPAARTGYFTAALLRELPEDWRISAFAWTWD